MSETRLVVREAGRDWSGTIHGSCADRAVAALSADPVTLAELEASVARFAKPVSNRQFFGNLSPGLCDEPYDAGLVVIDMPGPAFWHLDGSGMDDEFAFDLYHCTREEWDEERRKWDEHSRRFNAEWAERERLGVTDSMDREDGSSAVWSRSFKVADTADVPMGIRVFGVGCRLAELIADLRAGSDCDTTPRQTQGHIDQLNRDFGNLREILQGSDSSLSEALIDPVLDRFGETLADVARAWPDFAPKCESLTNDFRGLLDLPAAEPLGDSPDFDIPV